MGLPPAVIPMARMLPGVRELLGHARIHAPHAQAYVHRADASTVQEQCGLDPSAVCETLHDQRYRLGDMRVRVLHTPGHTPGSQCLLLESFKPMRVLTGDTMFIGSHGRIDGVR